MSRGSGFVDCCMNNPIVYYSIQACRWIPVVFIVGVLSWSYYAYVVELCWFTVDNVVERVMYLIPYHLFLFIFLWAYYQTVFSDIGKPPRKFYVPAELREQLKRCVQPSETRVLLDAYVRDQQLPVVMRAFDGGIRYCEKCHLVKPDRCHHCSICGHCVLKFDHHCPWVNTCVNYRNYKFFIHFLGYALLYCIFIFLTDIYYFIWFWREGMKEGGASKFHIMFMFFVSGMFAISVSTLFFYHIWLTAKNRSTLESFRAPVFISGPDMNGYNLGVRHNFKEIFGENTLLWFLPIFSARGDGSWYACADRCRTVPYSRPQSMTPAPPTTQPPPQTQPAINGTGHANAGFENNSPFPPLSNGNGVTYPLQRYDAEVDGLLNEPRRKWVESTSEDSGSDFDNLGNNGHELVGVTTTRPT